MKYTQKTNAPLYTPKAIKPKLSELSNSAKTEQLIRDIEASTLPENAKHFLRQCAYRHTVYHYGKIADYYAQSSPEVQRLMEDSALVIIDFNRAIELGFVKLRSNLETLRLEEEAKRDA